MTRPRAQKQARIEEVCISLTKRRLTGYSPEDTDVVTVVDAVGEAGGFRGVGSYGGVEEESADLVGAGEVAERAHEGCEEGVAWVVVRQSVT